MIARDATDDPLARFSPPTRAWFADAFTAPTEAQARAWSAIASGSHTLVVAPTGSGKTLAAFLWAIDDLLTRPAPEKADRCRVLYVSPLKALAADVERNLRSPLVGIRNAAARSGGALRELRVGTRTGDTPAAERRTLATAPPDIFITTPESLYLVLTSSAREGLRGVRSVIVDEVHALAGSKRGAHLALSLERLDVLLPAPAQRIGLSATVRPAETVARFLAGARAPDDGGRPVVVVQPPAKKAIQVDVVVPVPDLGDLASAAPPARFPSQPSVVDDDRRPGSSQRESSIWPHVEERLTDLILAHRSTIVFANSRRGAERLTARINECWAERLARSTDPEEPATGPAAAAPPDPGASWAATYPGQAGSAAARAPGTDLARAHHGSMSRDERVAIESELKAGRLPAVVATSSLELGIDMGAVDLVVQVGAPPSVASALQRIGRAGHQVGALSRGIAIPTHRGELLATAVIALRAGTGEIEALEVPENPLDVLAQQIVAMVSLEDWERQDLARLARRATPFAALGDRSLDAVLDMLAGRYPSEDFAELRPRLVWDRVGDVLSARPGAQRLAVTSGGTIPDRGMYGVYLAAGGNGGRRVGELDEEMVYESRVGDTFTLGSSTWRIEDITPDRVLVSPAPGLPGRLPFWRGDAPGRPAELGRALGASVRELAGLPGALGAHSPARARLAGWGLDDWAVDNLLAYLREQQEAAGHLADDRTIVVERFRDELGDWRLVIHSPWGARVHAPWALVVAARLRDRFGIEAQAMHGDDGIVLRLPDVSPTDLSDLTLLGGTGAGDGGTSSATADTITGADLVLDPDEVSRAVVDALAGSAHFAARFREAAARSLLLPRRRPDRRQPLWQQRQKSAQLLSVAANYPDFPVVLEAVRECVKDDFDVPALAELMQDIASRRIRVVDVTTTAPSPAARSLLFGYVGQFIYDGDTPLAERRAAALTLDPALLGELLGAGLPDVADLLDEQAVAEVEAEVGLWTEATRARDEEGVADLLRRLGPLTEEDVAKRSSEPPSAHAMLTALVARRRAIEVRLAGSAQWAVVEDAARLRDAIGVALPPGLPTAVLEPVADPLGDLIRRHGRTHGPFTVHDLATRFGLGVAVVYEQLRALERRGALVSGRLRPGGGGQTEYCDAEILRRIRRRSLARLRAEVEPVPQRVLAVFLPHWQSVGSLRVTADSGRGPGLRGAEGVLSVVDQLAGARVPASALESLVLPVRVRDYQPAMLDELLAAGDVRWAGWGALPGDDGFVALMPTEVADLLGPTAEENPELPSDLHSRLLAALRRGGAYYVAELVTMVARPEPDDRAEAAGRSPGTSARAVADALWDLVWAGLATNDSLGPLRARLTGGKVRHNVRRQPPRARAVTSRSWRLATGLHQAGTGPTPPDAGGRWSARPAAPAATLRATTLTAALLDRNGILTAGAAAELPGGFQAVYPTLRTLEEAGHIRRGYFVEGLGAAQFALPSTVDRLRGDARDRPGALLLAATDPANPYGNALSWPEAAAEGGAAARGHRPGRTAGACVVLVDGALVLYLERGGRSVLSFSADADALRAACAELAHAVGAGVLPRLVVERVDGESALEARGPVALAMAAAGFIATPRGLRLRHGAA